MFAQYDAFGFGRSLCEDLRVLIPRPHLHDVPNPERKFRLMERVRVVMAEHRYAARTVEAYTMWIRQYIEFHGRRHPRDLGVPEVRDFLSHLVVEKQVSASTQNQALGALKFLYASVLRKPLDSTPEISFAARTRRLPIVLSAGEVRAVLGQLRDPERLVVSLLYGSGLRIMECVSLRVKDVDVVRREIVVRGGKGNKDRRAPLAESAVADMRRALRRAHERWRLDYRADVRVTGIDGALGRKVPSAERDWQWYYVFPATRTFRDAAGVIRRHHLHESKIQRNVSNAARAARLGKRVTCHSFRHSFATHLLESGTDSRTIQELLGHSDVRTTMTYTHVMHRANVRSPADSL